MEILLKNAQEILTLLIFLAFYLPRHLIQLLFLLLLSRNILFLLLPPNSFLYAMVRGVSFVLFLDSMELLRDGKEGRRRG